MPSLSNISGGGHTSLGYYNPAFKIKIVAATDDMQQQASGGRNNQSDDFLDNLALGTHVTANIGKKKIAGTVTKIFRNTENESIFAQIITKDGKTYKVDGSRIEIGNNSQSPHDDSATSTPGFRESKTLSFSQFLNEMYASQL